jgi:uncharacterized membrane protein YwzB
MQCISHYILNFVKTHFISNRKSTAATVLFILMAHPLTYCKDVATLLVNYIPTMKETELFLVRLLSYFNYL